MTTEEYVRLKNAVTRHNSEAEREEGKLSMLLFEIMEQFGEGSLAAAEKRLKKLEKELLAAEAECDEEKEDFIREYGDDLGIRDEGGGEA